MASREPNFSLSDISSLFSFKQIQLYKLNYLKQEKEVP